MIRPFYVISPEYQTYRGSYEPPEPPEYGCDVFEVEAKTRREALIAGVRLALNENRSWASGNREDNRSPFVGYRVELAVCGHGNPHFQIINGKAVYLTCWACDALADRAAAEAS